MSWIGVALPIITAVTSLMHDKKGDLAAKTGLTVETVGKVSGVVSELLTKDERLAETIMVEIEKARQHDSSMGASNAMPLISLLRGLVRPVITLTAFFWYVYARCAGLPMAGEDYAIVGGIMAFWFGLRPFEKIGDGRDVAVSQLQRGK
ncbi:MAG: hypothetical protein EON60_02530 [Alphaproteobacteria bacterium]|nr:MAG: hypothetical protein EON60_02530 [Alphaproteobacteria bacterium]